MKIALPLLVFVWLYTLGAFDAWSAAAVALWLGYVINFLSRLNHSIAFREYILVMYGLNYLFSPAITYEITQNIAVYKMRLNPETYFSVAIPAILCLHAGLFLVKTRLFHPVFLLSKLQNVLNEKLLMQWLIAGFFISFLRRFLPGDLGFVAYLLGGLKYVAAFALFVIDRRKYKWYLYGLLFLEVSGALAVGMFHDMVVWILFFSMVWTYVAKPSALIKLVLGTVAVFMLFLLQTVKQTYRDALRKGEEGGIGVFSNVVDNSSGGGDGLFSMRSFALSLTRANQGWIFSSSMQYMDRQQGFQKMELVKKYAEAAFLPRALAPDKLEAGDVRIFNQFSGIRVLKGTSMGLGLFADGYISFGYWGALIFAFVFGLICALIFRIIEKWTLLSPFFALFCFPVLNYAVRPDCETQTWMGHIVKGAVVFSIVIYFTRRYFEKQTAVQSQKLAEDEPETQLVPVGI